MSRLRCPESLRPGTQGSHHMRSQLDAAHLLSASYAMRLVQELDLSCQAIGNGSLLAIAAGRFRGKSLPNHPCLPRLVAPMWSHLRDWRFCID